MKRTPLRKESKSSSAMLKREIQSLLRQIKLKEQKKCWVKLMGITEFGRCDEVMQYDHLETRARNISYANPQLGVLVCKRHHFFHGSPRREQRERYEELVRTFIGKERAKLWDRVRQDNRPYPMGHYEWKKEVIALTILLATYN